MLERVSLAKGLDMELSITSLEKMINDVVLCAPECWNVYRWQRFPMSYSAAKWLYSFKVQNSEGVFRRRSMA